MEAGIVFADISAPQPTEAHLLHVLQLLSARYDPTVHPGFQGATSPLSLSRKSGYLLELVEESLRLLDERGFIRLYSVPSASAALAPDLWLESTHPSRLNLSLYVNNAPKALRVAARAQQRNPRDLPCTTTVQTSFDGVFRPVFGPVAPVPSPYQNAAAVDPTKNCFVTNCQGIPGTEESW